MRWNPVNTDQVLILSFIWFFLFKNMFDLTCVCWMGGGRFIERGERWPSTRRGGGGVVLCEPCTRSPTALSSLLLISHWYATLWRSHRNNWKGIKSWRLLSVPTVTGGRSASLLGGGGCCWDQAPLIYWSLPVSCRPTGEMCAARPVFQTPGLSGRARAAAVLIGWFPCLGGGSKGLSLFYPIAITLSSPLTVGAEEKLKLLQPIGAAGSTFPLFIKPLWQTCLRFPLRTRVSCISG